MTSNPFKSPDLPRPDLRMTLIPLCHAINHLLAQEPWAQQKLLAHSGKTAAIDTGMLVLRLRVTADGFVEAAGNAGDAAGSDVDNEAAATSEATASDVTIKIKLSDLPLLATNAERAFSYVKIEGDADFANAISQVSQNVRWDAAHDLSKVIGEIAAQRLVSAAQSATTAMRSAHRSLTENLAEYFLEEQPMLVRPAAVSEMGGEIGKLRDDIERLAKRIEKLESKVP
jgi:ubiquinone biosynthesis protein UbiJ